MPTVLLSLVLIVTAVLTGYYLWKAEKAENDRRVALAAIAHEFGWRFVAGYDDDAPRFEVFQRGHSRAMFNTMFGALELCGQQCGARAGDFRYKVTTSNGKTTQTTTYNFSYLLVESPFPDAPPLLIRREGFLDKIADAFGFDDIDFESEEFSRRYRVKSEDKKFAWEVLHPRMIEYVMAGPEESLELCGGSCAFSDGKGRWKPEEFQRCLEFVRGFFALWPEHLTASLRARRAGA